MAPAVLKKALVTMRESTQTALVVDDDETLRQMVKRILEHSGFVVDSAKDGFEAIEKLARSDYAVVVLDLMMPRVDGFGVIDFLRRHREAALRKVIVLTAANIDRIYQERVAVVMNKPFDIHHLVDHALACSAG